MGDRWLVIGDWKSRPGMVWLRKNFRVDQYFPLKSIHDSRLTIHAAKQSLSSAVALAKEGG
jgi:hypothetical protein